MKEKDIDIRFKAEKESEYLDPPPMVWEDIEHDLKKNKRKKRFFVWWLVGFFFVLGASTYLFKNLDSSREGNLELATSSNKEIDSSNAKKDPIKSNEIQNEINLESEQSTQVENNPITNQIELEKAKSETSLNPSKATNSIHETENSTNKISNNYDRYESSDNSTKTPIVSNSKIKISPSTTVFESNINKNVTNSEKYLNGKNENDFQRRNIQPVSILNSNPFDLFATTRELKDPAPSYLPALKIDNRKLNSIAAFLHFGMPNFANVLTGQNADLIESDWYSYGIGIRYDREITNGFYLGAGANLRQPKRKFNYESDDLILLRYEQGLPVPTQPFEYGKLTSEGEQLFSFIDFSLGVKYKVWSRSINVYLGIDALYNLQLSSRGKALDNDAGIIRYTNDDKLYQSNLGFGYSPSITIDILIRQNFNLTLTPCYVSYFQNLENVQLLREMTYSNIGLDLGLSRKF